MQTELSEIVKNLKKLKFFRTKKFKVCVESKLFIAPTLLLTKFYAYDIHDCGTDVLDGKSTRLHSDKEFDS